MKNNQIKKVLHSMNGLYDEILDDSERAREFFRQYYNKGYLYSGNGDDLADRYNNESPSFLANFGHAIKQSGLDEAGLNRVMSQVSVQVTPYGSIPSDKNVFFDILASEPASINTIGGKVLTETLGYSQDLIKKVALIAAIGVGTIVLVNILSARNTFKKAFE